MSVSVWLGVGDQRAVIDAVADAILVVIEAGVQASPIRHRRCRSVGVGDLRAVVDVVADAILVDVEAGVQASPMPHRRCRSGRGSGVDAVVADVADAITIPVGLVGIRCRTQLSLASPTPSRSWSA
jgi:hypothetical protein